MATKHLDEYGEHMPHAHLRSRDYIESDIIANDTKDQLPVVSTIGRGPKGNGITVNQVSSEDGSYRLAFINTETNEVIEITPNLAPGHIEVTQPDHTMVPGEIGHATITYKNAGEVRSYDIDIPCGATGSMWYICTDRIPSHVSDVYHIAEQLLVYDTTAKRLDKLSPRPNDMVAFIDTDERLHLGFVSANEGGLVTIVSRINLESIIPYINSNGNWEVAGVDTKVQAQGPKGDPGLDAKIEIGNVETLPPSMGASVSQWNDPVTNVTTLSFGIPEGKPGAAIDIQGGIWTTDTLPKYDDTALNTAFIVYDGDKQFDLYIRGRIPVLAEDGGPWTVVEDWQGRPGNGVHVVKQPYELGNEIGDIVEVPSSEASICFAPYDYLTDGDVLIDESGKIGILGSSEDASSSYTMETIGVNSIHWDNVIGKPDLFPTTWDMVDEKPELFPTKWDMVSEKPFSNIDENGALRIEGDTLYSDPVTWENVYDKPFEEIGKGLSVEDGKLNVDEIAWSDVTDKPFDEVDDTGILKVEDGKLKTDQITWDGVADKPFDDIDPDAFKVEDGVLTSEKETWATLDGKPFDSVDTTGILNINEDGVLSAEMINNGGSDSSVPFVNLHLSNPVYNKVSNRHSVSIIYNYFIPDGIDASITFKAYNVYPRSTNPVSNIGLQGDPGRSLSTDAGFHRGSLLGSIPDANAIQGQVIFILSIDSNGSTIASGGCYYNMPAWESLADKPFSTIGDGLSVDDDGVLTATNDSSDALGFFGLEIGEDGHLYMNVADDATPPPLRISDGHLYYDLTDDNPLDLGKATNINTEALEKNSMVSGWDEYDLLKIPNYSGTTKLFVNKAKGLFTLQGNMRFNTNVATVTIPASDQPANQTGVKLLENADMILGIERDIRINYVGIADTPHASSWTFGYFTNISIIIGTDGTMYMVYPLDSNSKKTYEVWALFPRIIIPYADINMLDSNIEPLMLDLGEEHPPSIFETKISELQDQVATQDDIMDEQDAAICELYEMITADKEDTEA